MQQQALLGNTVVSTALDDEKVTMLFAWISRAFAGDARYGNLMLAFACIFGEHEPGSPYQQLVDVAMKKLDQDEDKPVAAHGSSNSQAHACCACVCR